MKTAMFPMLVVVAVLCGISDAHGQSEGVRNTIESGREVDLLRAELQLVRSYEDRLLSTVYWSLGTAMTLAALLIGFNWFTSVRGAQREKEALGQELKGILAGEIARLRTDLEASLAASLKTERDSLSAAAAQIEAAVSTQVAEATARLTIRLDDLEQHTFDLEVYRLTTEAKTWEMKPSIVADGSAGVPNNALRHYLKLLRLLVNQEPDHWLIGRTLEDVLRVLNMKGVWFDPDLSRSSEDLLTRVAKGNQAIVETIRSRISELARTTGGRPR